jgi:hypothetical protein
MGFGVISNFASLFLKCISEDQVIWFNLGWGDKAVKGNDSDEEEEKVDEEKEYLNQKEEQENGKKAPVVNSSAPK